MRKPSVTKPAPALTTIERFRFWLAIGVLWAMGAYCKWYVLTKTIGTGDVAAVFSAIVVQLVIVVGGHVAMNHRSSLLVIGGLIIVGADSVINTIGIDQIVPAINLSLDLTNPVLLFTLFIGGLIAFTPTMFIDLVVEDQKANSGS